MDLQIDRVQTEVVPTPEPPAADTPLPAVSPWVEIDRARAALANLLRDQSRTRAEGFDD